MTDKGKIIDKIRKLLRLARDKGASEHEAASAMAKASAMMLQHSIESVEECEEQIAVEGSRKEFGNQAHHFVFGQAVSKLYNCRHVAYRNQGIHWFVGSAANVEACELTMEYVLEQVEELYKQALQAFAGKLDKAQRSELRATFKQACALRVLHRINDIVAKMRNTIPDHKALVVIDQALAKADDMLAAQGTKSKKIAIRRSGLGTGAGFAAGEQVRIQKTVD